jgi:hypothetical protein
VIFQDSESCGLYGMPVLFQYAEDDGPIILHDIWRTPIVETIKLIEYWLTQDMCFFNAAFDFFHIVKVYNTLRLFPDWNEYPEDHIDEIALLEKEARFGPCLKPKSCVDLMLVARKGKYQALMQREEVRVRRVPTALAWFLAAELEKKVVIDDIFFARKKDKNAPRWKVYDIDDDPDFKDIILNFAASGALKTLAKYALDIKDDEILRFTDVEVNKAFWPVELGYAPFALAIGKPGAWNGAWPEHIGAHIRHWAFSNLARQYAGDDIKYTRMLYDHLGRPKPGDDDSELACAVAAVRWRGFKIDEDKIKKLRADALRRASEIPTAPSTARRYIEPYLDETERLVVDGSTRKVLLEEISKWVRVCKCAHYKCSCGRQVEAAIDERRNFFPVSGDDHTGHELILHINQECPECTPIPIPNDEGGRCWNKRGQVRHRAASRAEDVLRARSAGKEVELYDKLLIAGRFHASFIIIGARSSRMSGSDDLNPQGIKRSKEVRDCFIFADDGFELCGGDFDAFEVVLADATYNDPALREELLSGKKIHALFGEQIFPDMDYDSIMADKEKYTASKSGVFAMIYGGNESTLKTKLGVDLETANKAYQRFISKYPKVGEARKRVFDMFCSMRQPGGIGSKVEWHQPCDYMESLFGFRRYFTLENKVCKELFDLAQNPPKEWRTIKVKVKRRDREQTAFGAAQSALYAAAFNLQAGNMRAAANHEIQASGAQVTKRVQRRVWDIQPVGVNDWIVMPFNCHDEVLAPTKPEFKNQVRERVYETVESYRDKVPLIKMEWKEGMKSWAEK